MEIIDAIKKNYEPRIVTFVPASCFADFLYEMQIYSGLGVVHHQYNASCAGYEGFIDDFRPFYDSLGVDHIISYDEFCLVASNEKPPSLDLVTALNAKLDADKATRGWALMLRKSEPKFFHGYQRSVMDVANDLMDDSFTSFITPLKARMRDMEPKDRKVFANVVLVLLIKHSRRSIVEIAEAASCSPEFIRRQVRLLDKPYSAQALPILYRIGEVLTPENARKGKVQLASLLLLGFPRYLSPRAMLKAVDEGEMTAGQMVHQYRAQLGLSSEDFGKALANKAFPQGFEISYIAQCEKAPNSQPATTALSAIASHMKLFKGDKETFIKRAKGVEGINPDKLRGLITRAMNKQATFSDVVKYIVQSEFALRQEPHSGLSSLARAVEVNASVVHDWYHGRGHIKEESLARKFAAVAKVPQDLIEDFVKVATNNVVYYDPEIIENCERETAYGRRDLFNALLRMNCLTQRQFAAEFGISKRSLEEALKQGAWSVRRVSLQEVAVRLIPEAHSSDRADFVTLFGNPKRRRPEPESP